MHYALVTLNGARSAQEQRLAGQHRDLEGARKAGLGNDVDGLDAGKGQHSRSVWLETALFLPSTWHRGWWTSVYAQ